jgi:hypothetical protein
MKTFLTGLAAVSLWTGAACAQANAPPMDMSWAFPWMNGLQAEGDRRAADAAQQYYDYMQRLREQGYTGPSLPTGITPYTMREAVERANRATAGYIQNEQRNQDRRQQAIERWDQRVLRGGG